MDLRRHMTDSPVSAALLIAAGYYLGARLGFALTLAPVPVAILWPPNAILFAGLILTPPRTWALVLTAVFGAHLAVQFQTGVPPAMVLSWFVSNCTEALIGAALLRRPGQGAVSFETFRGVALFLGAGTCAAFLSSFLDAGLVAINAWGDSGYWTVWRTRFFANVLASITLVPVLVMTARGLGNVSSISRKALAEGGAGLAVLTCLCWVVFVRQQPGPGVSPALLYAPVPLLVGAAIRFGPWGAGVSMLTCAMVAIWGASQGQGPFVTSSALDNALSIQLFLIVAWIPVMSLAAVVRERARAEAYARSSEAHLALAIEAAQLGRWEWDLGAGSLTWSDIAFRTCEVAPDERVTPAAFEALVHPDDRAGVSTSIADCLTTGRMEAEFRIRFSDGRVTWIFLKGRTLLDEAGRPERIVAVSVDVTARKTAELQIQEQRRNLAQLAPLSTAGELSAALAHEVNQPLAAILANASAARRFLRHDPPAYEELGEIVDAIADDNRRAASVIARFGTLLKKGNARWARLDINDVVRGALDVAQVDIISRGVSLTTQFADGLPQVHGDAVQLQEVLLHLLVNACDAMDAMPSGARRAAVTTGTLDGRVRVTVSDTGPGVQPDLLEKIFEPFFTSKPHRLGVSLAVCRSRISAHGGDLSVENRRDGGTDFTFSLPATVDARVDPPVLVGSRPAGT